jgi:lipopolysaccharide export system protein LptC
MSEAAVRDRASRQRWANPGSSHDRLVRFGKVALPSAVGVLIAYLAMAPLDKEGDVSFILDKKKVENAPERMRVESARYVGEDNRGQKFEIRAQSALQRSSDVPIVDIQGMRARLGLSRGPVLIRANEGNYNLDTGRVAVRGPIQVAGRDGEELATRNVLVDLKQRTVTSDAPVAGRLPVGTFRAGELGVDLSERTVSLGRGVSGQIRLGSYQAGRLRVDLKNRVLILDGGARLKIVQGAVR